MSTPTSLRVAVPTIRTVLSFKKKVNETSSAKAALLRGQTKDVAEYAAVEIHFDRNGDGEEENNSWLLVERNVCSERYCS